MHKLVKKYVIDKLKLDKIYNRGYTIHYDHWKSNNSQ